MFGIRTECFRGIAGDDDFRVLPSTIDIMGFTQKMLDRAGICRVLDEALFLAVLDLAHGGRRRHRK